MEIAIKKTIKREALKELLQEAYDCGKKNEKSSMGCAQSTLLTIMETLGIENDDVFKSACGLAGGIGLSGDGSCGALTGGAMGISFIYGKERRDFKKKLKSMKAYKLAKEYHDYFIDKYDTCRCSEIQNKLVGRSFNLWSKKDLLLAAKYNMSNHCSGVVGDAAQKAVEIIIKNMKQLYV
jgi:C_GCAxxG_C_C family probable redox protein